MLASQWLHIDFTLASHWLRAGFTLASQTALHTHVGTHAPPGSELG